MEEGKEGAARPETLEGVYTDRNNTERNRPPGQYLHLGAGIGRAPTSMYF